MEHATDRANPLTRWRQGDRDDEAREAHNAEIRDLRRAAAAGRLGPSVRAYILREVADGRRLPEVAAALGISTNAIHGLARTDPGWRRDLETAVMDGRDPDIEHGAAASYRRQRCRCRDCREAHHAGDRQRATHDRTRPVAPRERACECCAGPLPPDAGPTRRFCSPSCGTRHAVHATCRCGGVRAPE